MKNIEVVFIKEYESLNKARLIEKRLKKLKRRDYVDDIIITGNIKMK